MSEERLPYRVDVPDRAAALQAEYADLPDGESTGRQATVAGRVMLLRDQGNSAYMRDTGDPTTAEGGMIEWGYYEEKSPRLCHPRELLEKHQARLSPSQRDLDMEQILEPLERAIEYISADEFVEATPKSLRLRKRILDPTARKRAQNAAA